MKKQLVHFLQEDLAIPAEAIAIAMRRCELIPHQLPMILWLYGLITLEQLEKIFDWIDA